MIDDVIREDQQDPTSFRPLVAIGHTKDLIDLESIESLLAYLHYKCITITGLSEAYDMCNRVASSKTGLTESETE
jgi:hypothetical protein